MKPGVIILIVILFLSILNSCTSIKVNKVDHTGLKIGKWISTSEDKTIICYYSKGLLNGKYLVYSKSGIQTEGKYKNGKKHGRWVFYNCEGFISAEFTYIDDVARKVRLNNLPFCRQRIRN